MKLIEALIAVMVTALAVVASGGELAEASTPSSGGSTGGTIPEYRSHSTAIDDPALVALKESYRIRLDTNRRPVVVTAQMAAAAPELNMVLLDSTFISKIIEPEGTNSFDDHHIAYTDKNYWNFCASGAAAAIVDAWGYQGYPADTFTEPYGPHSSSTYWASSDTGTSSDTGDGYSTKRRNYVMYIAEVVDPPSFLRDGLGDFDTYPGGGASLKDTKDVLNWEVSGHDTQNWNGFFYFKYMPTSQSDLHAKIVNDLNQTVGVIATVDTLPLPNWDHSVAHSIAIIGYDDTASTYTYVDTCGKRCNGSPNATNGGTWTISQSSLWSAVQAHGIGIAW